MGEVYTRCSKCLVWLGEMDQDDGDAAFDMIDELADGSYVISNEDWGPHSLLCRNKVGALSRFVQRPWWHRAWVVQEDLLSNNIEYWCGPRMVTRTRLVAAWEKFANFWRNAYGESTTLSILGCKTCSSAIRTFLDSRIFLVEDYELGHKPGEFRDRK
jgi:hypothetical protein